VMACPGGPAGPGGPGGPTTTTGGVGDGGVGAGGVGDGGVGAGGVGAGGVGDGPPPPGLVVVVVDPPPTGTNLIASIAASPLYELPLSPTNVIVGVPFVGRSIFPDFHTFPWLPVCDQTDTPSTKTDSLPMLLPYMWYLNSSCMGIDNTSGGDESFAFCP